MNNSNHCMLLKNKCVYGSDKFMYVFWDSEEKRFWINRFEKQYEERPEGKWSNNCVMTCILVRKNINCHGELSDHLDICRQKNHCPAEFLMTWE